MLYNVWHKIEHTANKLSILCANSAMLAIAKESRSSKIAHNVFLQDDDTYYIETKKAKEMSRLIINIADRKGADDKTFILPFHLRKILLVALGEPDPHYERMFFSKEAPKIKDTEYVNFIKITKPKPRF